MSGLLEGLLSVTNGLIEAGPVKIDNKFVEIAVGLGAVGIAGYAAYKILSDKQAAENISLLSKGFASQAPLDGFGAENRSGLTGLAQFMTGDAGDIKSGKPGKPAKRRKSRKHDRG
ncbi:hypothetical protein [Pseudomonas sp. CGJS7]|uniref:hypothetical protein n=1 Tax=Pseudomonas sp. CGJS7 TaxID=3109348 RepID=UPI0030086115